MTKNKRKFDVLVVGELNVDIIFNGINSLPAIGKEILSKEMTLTMGSSSAIFAANLSMLGVKTAFAGRVGNDIFGSMVLDTLKSKKIGTRYIYVSNSDKTGATVVLNYDNDRAMVTFPGSMENLTEKDITDEMLHSAGHMHLSSAFLQKGLKPDIVKLFERAKNAGMTTSLDVQWDPEEKWDLPFDRLLPLVDVFLPNKQELTAITGKTDIKDVFRVLDTKTNTIVVKMSTEGSMGFKEGQLIHVPAFLNESVVDAIGAGDSFNAGFISKYIQNKPLGECLEFGNLMGAVNTTAAGGTGAFQTPEQVNEIAKKRFGKEF